MANEKSVEIQISFPEHLRGGVYSNNMIVAHTKEEFFLDFLMVAPPSGTVTARVILSPGHVKRVVGALQENLAKPAFLTRVRREAVETGVDARRATEGTGDVVDTTSRSPTERNAAGMPVSAAAAEAW